MSTPLQLLASLLGSIVGVGVFLPFHRRSLEAAGRKETDILLRKSPNEFGSLDVFYLILRLLIKYIYSALGLSASLRPSRSASQNFDFPRIQAQGILKITQKDVDRFDTAVRSGSSTSKTNIILLPALTGPLVIYILTLKSCPIKPLGAVNTRNQITTYSPICQDGHALITASSSNRLSYIAAFGASPGRRVKRGVEFEIHVDIFLADSNGGGKERIMTQKLEFLQFLPQKTLPHFLGQSEDKPDLELLTKQGLPELEMKIGKDAPRKWAACNKDFNPIHISTIGAKLFGQKSVIAHGMHAVALAIQMLGNAETPFASAHDICWADMAGRKSWTVDMRFLRPISLPAVVSLRGSPGEKGDEATLAIVRNGKVLTSIKCWRE